MIQIKIFRFNIFQENTYVVWDDCGKCVIIDPGQLYSAEYEELPEFIRSRSLKPEYIILTHAHLDHIFGLTKTLEDFPCTVLMDEREVEVLEKFNPVALQIICPGSKADTRKLLGDKIPSGFEFSAVCDGQRVSFGNSEFKILSTPGHSPGGICLLFEKDRAVFTGDTLFAGSIGRTDNDQADYDLLMRSIKEKLMTLDGDIRVYPGHGPATDIATERTTNPFIYGPSDEDFAITPEE